jgi:hypothetical protein
MLLGCRDDDELMALSARLKKQILFFSHFFLFPSEKRRLSQRVHLMTIDTLAHSSVLCRLMCARHAEGKQLHQKHGKSAACELKALWGVMKFYNLSLLRSHSRNPIV